MKGGHSVVPALVGIAHCPRLRKGTALAVRMCAEDLARLRRFPVSLRPMQFAFAIAGQGSP